MDGFFNDSRAHLCEGATHYLPGVGSNRPHWQRARRGHCYHPNKRHDSDSCNNLHVKDIIFNQNIKSRKKKNLSGVIYDFREGETSIPSDIIMFVTSWKGPFLWQVEFIP